MSTSIIVWHEYSENTWGAHCWLSSPTPGIASKFVTLWRSVASTGGCDLSVSDSIKGTQYTLQSFDDLHEAGRYVQDEHATGELLRRASAYLP